MAKKNRKSTKPDEMEIDSAATLPPETPGESTRLDSRQEAESLDQLAEEQTSAQENDELSSDDLLDDVRRSLIEDDESEKEKKDAKWWRRIGRKDRSAEPEPPSTIAEIDLPESSFQTDIVEQQPQETEPDAYAEEIDDLIDLLQAEQQDPNAEPSPVPAETVIAPEPEMNLEELKEQAFRPRSPDEVETDVRSIALEGGEEVFVEVEAQAADPLEERLKTVENALQPYRSYIYMTFAFLGVVMAVIASFLIFNAYRQSREEPVQPVSNLPYPVAVSLPGGWSFNLGRGALQGGNWEPKGAEWLEGTEVCRWVSLPWNVQLEAVIRTLNPGDPVELVISNNDKLTYGVYSVREMTLAEIHEVDASTPCLLVILTGADTEERWVLTAIP